MIKSSFTLFQFNAKIVKIVAIFCFLMMSGLSQAQILTFEFDAGGSLTSNSNSANITSSTISYTTGTLTSTTAPPSGFTVSTWANAVTIDLTEYFQFTVTPVVNGSFTITTMVMNISRGTNGPQTFAIRNSLDNYAADITTGTVSSNGTTAQVITFNVNQISSSSAVTYRIYGYNGAGNKSGAGGFSGTGNDIIVNGTATSSNFSGSAVISRPGRSSICLGDSSSIAFNITGGTAPYTIQTIDNLGLLRTHTGVQSNTPIYVYPQETKTYSINSLTDNNGQALLAANFSGSAVVTVTTSPVATTTGNYTRTLAHNDGLTLTYADGSLCKSWVKITDALGGTNPGSTTCSANVYSSIPINSTSRYFIPRRVIILPTTNGNADVTLFYSQAEFTAFNSAALYHQKLPANSTDTAGVLTKVVIRRTQSDTETVNLTSFTPTAVVWNAANSQWEVTIAVNDGILGGRYYLSTPFNTNKLVASVTHTPTTPVTGATNAIVTVDWPDVSGVTQYRLRYRKVGTSTWSVSTVTGSQKLLDNLLFSTSYEVQVRVFESGLGQYIQGEYTTSYTFTTPTEPNKLPNCNLPTNVSVNLKSPTSVKISWLGTTYGINYIVESRVKNTLNWGVSSTAADSIWLDYLMPNTTYEYRIRTTCQAGTTENGYSAFSTADTFKTPAIDVCGSISNPSTQNITAAGATLKWSHVPFATSYQIQTRLKNTATWGGTSRVDTFYVMNNLSASSTYEYRVRALCNASPMVTTTNTGAFTTIGEFTTSSATVLPSCLPPANINAVPTSNSIAVSWDSAAYGPQYFINIKQASSNTWGGTTVTGFSRTFTGLTPATAYHIRVRTMCTPGATISSTSAFSDTVFVSTTTLANKAITGNVETPVLVYPNPTNQLLHVDYGSNTNEHVFITMVDITGRIVYSNSVIPMLGQNNIDISMDGLQDGLYFIRLQQGGVLRFVGNVRKIGQ